MALFCEWVTEYLAKTSINNIAYSDNCQVLELSNGDQLFWPITVEEDRLMHDTVPVFGRSGRPQRSIEEPAIQTVAPNKPRGT